MAPSLSQESGWCLTSHSTRLLTTGRTGSVQPLPLVRNQPVFDTLGNCPLSRPKAARSGSLFDTPLSADSSPFCRYPPYEVDERAPGENAPEKRKASRLTVGELHRQSAINPNRNARLFQLSQIKRVPIYSSPSLILYPRVLCPQVNASLIQAPYPKRSAPLSENSSGRFFPKWTQGRRSVL